MKKNLLTVGLLVINISISAQDLTYVGNSCKFYVETGALVFSGGNWLLDSNTEKTVENKGNIIIVGDYKKGSTTTNAASDGKEFVNIYTGINDYGQVQILNSTNATNALMTMQKPAASTNYFGADYAISFPFKDQVSYVMTAFGKTPAEFAGSCPLDAFCGWRYNQTLFKWNNSKIQFDAVPNGSIFKAGDYYTINLRATGNLQSAMTGLINYKGTPDPLAYSQKAVSVIPSMDESSFSNLGYNDWKLKVNPYNEYYKSYMGDINSTNKVTGKNVYRFGNPYTSNLDLSAVDGANSWLYITNDGSNKSIKAATDAQMIKDFTITKRTPAYDINWNPLNSIGSTAPNADYYSAKYDAVNSNWVGNPEALIIRPLETFNLNFPLVNPTALGTRIVHVSVNFNDFHKTFAYPANVASTTITPKNASVSAKRSVAVVGRSATAYKTATVQRTASVSSTSTVSNVNSFYQAEMFLLSNGAVEAAPVYAVGSKNYTESANAATTNNKMFLYGISSDATKAASSQNTFNEFNSTTYIGKPIDLGFNNLAAGNTYEIRFNLYEGSIFNSVKNISDGDFYIKDNVKNTVEKVSADKSYSFVADADMKGRLALYWKEASVSGGSSGTLAATDLSKTENKTFVYKDNSENWLRMEKEFKKADVEVYDMSGRLINKINNISTAQDQQMVFPADAVYVIKVTYDNSVVRTTKATR